MVLYKAGSKVICSKCRAHVATIARDLYSHDRVVASMFEENQGQGPWRNCERANCRECGEPFMRKKFNGVTEFKEVI